MQYVIHWSSRMVVLALLLLLCPYVSNGQSNFSAIWPDGYDPTEQLYDHEVHLDVSIDYRFTSKHVFPTLHVNISRSSYECETRYFIDFIKPVTPLFVGPALGRNTSTCANYNNSYEQGNWSLGVTEWNKVIYQNQTWENFTLSYEKFEKALRTGCDHPAAVTVREQQVTLMQQTFTQYVYSWKVWVCQISIMDAECSAPVSKGLVANTCKAFPASLSLVPNVVSSLQASTSVALSAADFFIKSFDATRDDCADGHERGKSIFTVVLPQDFKSFSGGSAHRTKKPLALMKLFAFDNDASDYSSVSIKVYIRLETGLSDGRKLYEMTVWTPCVWTGLADDGTRERSDAFVSLFAPPGTGYAEVSFELRAEFLNMTVLLKLNMLVTPSFFDLPIEHMVYSGEHLNHSIHIGYGDSVKNAPEFVGYYMIDDYICSKQQLSVGAATLRPMRVAFCLLTPEASSITWAGKVIDISVKGEQRKASFGCQEDSWIDMSDAVFSDGKYTFNSEPRVVKGVHETILWFVTGSDISTGMVPSVLPHQEVGEFVDAFLVYYNSSAQSIVSKATRGARKLEVYNSEIQLNCTNQPQSCNIACFRIKAKENALNKIFLVHHDSVVHFPTSKRRLLSDDDELQSLKAGTILLNTRQSNMTAYVTMDIQTDRQMDS